MTAPDTTEPHNLWTEQTVLGGLLTAGIPTDMTCAPSDFWDPKHQTVANAIWDLSAQSKPVDPVSVRAELMRGGVRGEVTDGAWLHTLMAAGCPAGSLTFHGRELAELTTRRELLRIATRAEQRAQNASEDVHDLAAWVMAESAKIADAGDAVRPVNAQTFGQFMAGEETYDWLIPGLFERAERLILTGEEGAGKTMLLRQIAACSAAGIHPFDSSRTVDPVTVLHVDLENPDNITRRKYRQLVDALGMRERDLLSVPTFYYEPRMAGVNLLAAPDHDWLMGLCESTQPDLLVIGPLYKMHEHDMNLEEPARKITVILDTIRARFNCTIVTEAHAGNGTSGNLRDLRPIGSSFFRRWPEFGFGIRATEGSSSTGIFDLKAWRGARDERGWPKQLVRGGEQEFPWQQYGGLKAVGQRWGQGA